MRRSRWNASNSRKALRKPPGGTASSTRCGKSRSFVRPTISRLRRVISPNPPPLRVSPPHKRDSSSKPVGEAGRPSPYASTRSPQGPFCKRANTVGPSGSMCSLKFRLGQPWRPRRTTVAAITRRIREREHRLPLAWARRVRTIHSGCDLTALVAGFEGALDTRDETLIHSDKALTAESADLLIPGLRLAVLAVRVFHGLALAWADARHGTTTRKGKTRPREPTSGSRRAASKQDERAGGFEDGASLGRRAISSPRYAPTVESRLGTSSNWMNCCRR